MAQNYVLDAADDLLNICNANVEYANTQSQEVWSTNQRFGKFLAIRYRKK
jgi:hypothetical protein